jgi:PAS domain S-box-containing protein
MRTNKIEEAVDYSFLSRKSKMTTLVRQYDWSKTSIGPISTWPQSLRLSVNLVLGSTVPIVMLWGKDGIMIYNDEYSLFAGARHPQLLGSKVLEGWPEVAEFNRNVMEHGLAGKNLEYFNQQLTLYRNGVAEEVWMDLHYSPIADESGRPAGVMAIVFETTEKVLAEKKQQEAEAITRAERQKLQQLFNSAPAYVAVLHGSEHIYSLVNPLYKKLVGGRNIVGKSVREALPEIAGSGLYEILDEVYNTGQPFIGNEIPVRLDRTDEGKFETGYFNFVYQPLRDENNQVTDIFVHAVEVTEQISTLKKLEESKLKFDALFDSNIVAIAQVDLNGNIQDANKTFLKLFGYNKSDLKKGLSSQQLNPIGPDDITTSIYESLKNTGEAEPVEKKYRRKDGTEFPGYVGAAMIPYSKDQFMAFILDMSENEKLKALNQVKDEFIALASHQLRTPATSVKQYLGVVMDGFAGPVSDDQLEYLKIANKSNNRQLDIIDDLLKTAHLDAKDYKLNIKSKDVVKVIKEVMQHYLPVLDAKDQRFEFASTQKSLKVNLDAEEIATCFANLIENASKYSPNGSIIEINVEPDDKFVSVIFTDHGVGINKPDHDKIFDKFTRVNNPLSDTVSGNGLGLYWVKRIVNLHNGEIFIKSRVGKGTSFIVHLPI